MAGHDSPAVRASGLGAGARRPGGNAGPPGGSRFAAAFQMTTSKNPKWASELLCYDSHAEIVLARTKRAFLLSGFTAWSAAAHVNAGDSLGAAQAQEPND